MKSVLTKFSATKQSLALLALPLVLSISTNAFSGSYGYNDDYDTTPIVKQTTEIGTVWATSKGMTLYTFDMDKDNRSNCNGRCAKAWPPLLAAKNAKTNGVFSTITRNDGTKQWTLNGEPLYTWIKDKKSGDTTGDGVKGVWHAAMTK
ncbi:lipoprotein [Marinomonas mediterranea]|jgi:Uncharacterized protein conserved in bacteria|uniref:Putative lipoprotein n=1 Tax=Marinomonas mediterranea (strain ATCC 700492 / JCM 21426 / NBRC 103028 / MMB-1) TaxID=717774 RepID=F2JXW4_MARM1|nr:lipoprotein [Marinomonas mediterranea]ADZ89613.1 putative lipoprotein [Marinomonas mediterranea MMB-1]WCN07705.1 hypothetical protein GV055_01585 [Marinomonas mediterranea]WCN11806.1 hypothetical protein GV054_01610 [Marinomonas mediterranea]WCN15855.1 hypothetical protein GV053_01575 [Marinomonas mediterranea MMB-1]